LRGVIVNFTDDPATAIQGVLWSASGPWLTIKDASLLKPGQPPTAIDGDVVLHRDRVSFLQVPR
jgi:hypothetical protein